MDSDQWNGDYTALRSVVVYALDEGLQPSYHLGPSVATAIVSGGCFRPASGSGTSAEIVMPGLLEVRFGRQFAMGAVARLVDADDRVVIHIAVPFYDGKWEEWLEGARSSGFEIIDLGPARGPHDVICVGTGRILPGFEWIGEDTDAYSNPLLVASHGPIGPLECAMLAGADRPADALNAVDRFISHMDGAAHVVDQAAGGYSVIASLTGTEGTDLLITRRSTGGCTVSDALRSTALDLGVMLYRAGNSDRTASTALPRRADLWWVDWRPMPDQWERVV